jgi:hypothetical protein
MSVSGEAFRESITDTRQSAASAAGFAGTAFSKARLRPPPSGKKTYRSPSLAYPSIPYLPCSLPSVWLDGRLCSGLRMEVPIRHLHSVSVCFLATASWQPVCARSRPLASQIATACPKTPDD